ncbi:hypothetical protein ACA910_021639 [Epithemia clementina (nom. ined.)]
MGMGGSKQTNLMAEFPGYGPVWFLPDGPVNILSFSNLRKHYHIYYNSHLNDEFQVTSRLDNHLICSFMASPQGLYYHAMSGENAQVLVTTVANARAGYSQTDYQRAVGARRLQVTLGRPNSRYLAHLLDRHLIPNCPYTSADIKAADNIFGTELGILKGKTTRHPSERVETNNTMHQSPKYITLHERYKQVTLCIDVMHVKGIPFLVTLSRHIHFGTIDALPNLQATMIMQSLQAVLGVYKQNGFNPQLFMADGAFESLQTHLAHHGITINATSRDEHVGEIERFICTIKERMRANYTLLPFSKIPRIMLINMAKHAVFWLNALVYPRGVSQDLGPRQIVLGEHIGFNRHCCYEFGQYCQTHEEHDNSMAARMVGAIALHPTGNCQGSYYFMSLLTGRVLNQLHATPLPMPAEVIDRVHALAEAQDIEPDLMCGNCNNHIVAQPSLEPDNVDEDLDDPTFETSHEFTKSGY